MLCGYRWNVGLATLLVVLGTLGANLDARAGISYELIFRSTGTDQVEFGSVEEARSAAVVSDLIMTTTDALIGNSISVGWDDSKGLDVTRAGKWSGLAIPGGFYSGALGGPVRCDRTASQCKLFTGFAPVPNAPPSLPPGTYNIGTLIWDTTDIEAGVSTIFPFLDIGVDGTGGVIPPASRNIVFLTGTEVLFPSFINVVPEPATAGLLAMGLLGILLARRRADG